MDVDYSSRSKLIATGHTDNILRLWDPRSEGNIIYYFKVMISLLYILFYILIMIIIWICIYTNIEGTNVKQALRGHSAWISSVSWSKSSEYLLCSGSYDSTVRVWDIRSKGPLYTVNSDSEKKQKIFSVDWDEQFIISGGEDKELRIYQTKV